MYRAYYSLHRNHNSARKTNLKTNWNIKCNKAFWKSFPGFSYSVWTKSNLKVLILITLKSMNKTGSIDCNEQNWWTNLNKTDHNISLRKSFYIIIPNIPILWYTFLLPGKSEPSCENKHCTMVPLKQPTVHIEDKDPVPEEQVIFSIEL